jgi:hypothetical protein
LRKIPIRRSLEEDSGENSDEDAYREDACEEDADKETPKPMKK